MSNPEEDDFNGQGAGGAAGGGPPQLPGRRGEGPPPPKILCRGIGTEVQGVVGPATFRPPAFANETTRDGEHCVFGVKPYLVPDGWPMRNDCIKAGVKRPDPKSLFNFNSSVQPNVPYWQLVENAVHVTEQLMDVKLKGKCLSTNSNTLPFAGAATSYIFACRVNCLTIIVLGTALGFNMTSKNDLSIGQICEQIDMKNYKYAPNREFYEQHILNLQIYLFEYVIPPYLTVSLFDEVGRCTWKTARDFMVRADKLRYPLWSCGFVDRKVITRGEKHLCSGHNYHYALVFDCILECGMTKLVDAKHQQNIDYLTRPMFCLVSTLRSICTCGWGEGSSQHAGY
jgi:hypothetical protein